MSTRCLFCRNESAELYHWANMSTDFRFCDQSCSEKFVQLTHMDRRKVVSTIDGIVPGGDKNIDWQVLKQTFDPEKPDKAFEVISKLPPAMIQTTPFSIANIFTKRLARSDGELERHEALESYLRSAFYTTNFVRFAYFSMVLQGDSRDMSPFQGVLLRERLVPLLNQERPPLVYNNQDREYLERIYWGVRCGVWLDDAFVPAPDQLDNFIRTALNQKKNALLKFLVEKFNPIISDVFIEAFATGNTTIMRWLMDTRNVRVTDALLLGGEGKRATRNALQFCYLDALRLLLEAGATPAFFEQVYRSSKRIDMGNPELYRFFQDECHLDIPQPIDGDEERPLELSSIIPLKERLNILLNDYRFNQFVELATKEWNSGVTLNLPSGARFTYRIRTLVERHRAAFPLLYLEEALQYRWEDREVFQAMRKNRTPFHMVDDLLEEDYRTHLPHLVYLAVAISRIDILAYLAAIGADIGPIYAHPNASVAVIQWMMQRNPLPTPADIRKAINETKRADVRFFLRQQSYDDDAAEPPMRRIAEKIK